MKGRRGERGSWGLTSCEAFLAPVGPSLFPPLLHPPAAASIHPFNAEAKDVQASSVRVRRSEQSGEIFPGERRRRNALALQRTWCHYHFSKQRPPAEMARLLTSAPTQRRFIAGRRRSLAFAFIPYQTF